jgi:glutathione S-transferase
MPPALDWVERQLGGGALGAAFGIAEIAVGAQLANLRLAGEKVDAARWPRLAAFADRTLARPSFAKLLEGGAFPH